MHLDFKFSEKTFIVFFNLDSLRSNPCKIRYYGIFFQHCGVFQFCRKMVTKRGGDIEDRLFDRATDLYFKSTCPVLLIDHG